MTPTKFGKALFFGMCLGAAMLALGCGGSSSPPVGGATISVSISPATSTVPVGTTEQFLATVTGTSNISVTWSVNGIAGGSTAVGTITTAGLYTAPNTAPSPNNVTVKATSQADPTKSASAVVTITVPALTLSFLNPIVAMQNSGELTLTANGGGFLSGTQVLFNGVAQATTFVSATQLTAQIPSTDLAQPGTFPVAVRIGAVTSGALNFFVVPAINIQPVSVSGGRESGGVNISVQEFNPPRLSLIAVGVGRLAGNTGVSVRPGGGARLFLVGQGIVPGTFYMVSGILNDVSVRQPLEGDFSETSDGTPAVTVSVSASPSAAPGPRNLLVTNPDGEISAFVGGLRITPGS